MKKTFAILLSVLLALALLICACGKDEPAGDETQPTDTKPVVTDTESESGTDIEPVTSESASETESESEIETVPVIDLGTQVRPVDTSMADESDTDFAFDSNQMTPDEEAELTQDSAYFDSQLAGAAPGNK